MGEARRWLARRRHDRAETAYVAAIVCAATMNDGGFHRALAARKLAMLHAFHGRWTRAQAALESALAVFEARLESDHPLVTSTLYLLREAHQEQGRREAARQAAERLNMVLAAIRDPDQPVLMSIVGEGVPNSRGRSPEVEIFFWPSQDVLERTRQSPRPASALGLLAQYHHSRGWYEFAEALYRQSLRSGAVELGTRDPRRATDLENLAALLRTLGRRVEADRCQAEAHAIRARENPAGPPGPDT